MQKQTRIVIHQVSPQLDGGLYPIKRIVGQAVHVQAHVFADGHDVLACSVHYKHESEKKWTEVRMHPSHNDEWFASFLVTQQGNYSYYVEGWVDYALNWQHGIERKIQDNQKVTSELLEGATYVSEIADKLKGEDKAYAQKLIELFQDDSQYDQAVQDAVSSRLHQLFIDNPVKLLQNSSPVYPLYVDRKKALFSTWYEFFPRSASESPGKHGTFKDCERLLPRVAQLGFDTLYFPPIHPIGEVNRKGKNNATTAQPGDVGSPWGIGSQFGGHKATHPELGSVDDFKSLVQKANELGIEVAVDFALQAAPDHPYVKEFPQWFKWRPDGTVQYAENPPKKYQDILPIYFETADWKNLWKELLDAALFWVEECGIRVFRVDNPHTKPFYFWGWLIGEVKKKHPDVLFLAEAFTRPKIMHELAKQGFTQSYTYYTWRNNKAELMEYLHELTQTDQKEFFRPNFWPNTPDINPSPLQTAGESIHLQRYFLAATLSSNVGVYGPVYEYRICAPYKPGGEEYLDSEKYELAHWDWSIENSITQLYTQVNAIRRENTSLQQTENIVFCETNNDQILAYYKYDDSRENETLMVVSLNTESSANAMLKLPAEINTKLRLTDLLTGASYVWDSEYNYVELAAAYPFHLFKIERI